MPNILCIFGKVIHRLKSKILEEGKSFEVVQEITSLRGKIKQEGGLRRCLVYYLTNPAFCQIELFGKFAVIIPVKFASYVFIPFFAENPVELGKVKAKPANSGRELDRVLDADRAGDFTI